MRRLGLLVVVCTAVVLLLAGCSPRLSRNQQQAPYLYTATGQPGSLIARFAPQFLIYDPGQAHNRIGRPQAAYDDNGEELISVNPDAPVIYYDLRRFTTEKGTYTNLIYRIHFKNVPFKLVPFYLTAGNNSGLLVIVTIDQDLKPLLVTTVGTCGCYVTVTPTTALASETLPAGWPLQGEIVVYGERLPSRIDFSGSPGQKLLVPVRPDVHRVMGLGVRGASEIPASAVPIAAPLVPTVQLESLPINGGQTSFYHTSGPLKGHVKGALKPWETLLMSWLSLDLFVGTDKIYGDTAKSGNPFYTSLKPWNRRASDLNDFAGFLEFNGWRL